MKNAMRLLILVLITNRCTTVLPSEYKSLLIGKWENIEKIQTSSGIKEVTSEAIFTEDHSYQLTTIDPVDGTTILNFQYQIGTILSFPAFILLNNLNELVQDPIFFSFSNNNTELVTSTNMNQVLKKVWKKL